MIAGILVIGTVLLVLPGVEFRPTGRSPAGELVPLAGISLALGVLVVEMGLAFLAMPTVLRAVRLVGLAGVCEDAFGGLTVTNPVIGWAAALAAVVLPLCVGRSLWSARRAARTVRAEPWLGEHVERGAYDLVTVPTTEPLAISVPGRPPQVIVSEGLLAALETAEIESVIDHEAAHLRLGHRRYLLLATAAASTFGWFPPARASIARLRALTEAAADEAAAGGNAADRRAFSHVISRVACADNHRSADDVRTPVLERVLRLRERCASTRAARAMTAAPLVVLTMVVMMLLVGWFSESHHAVALGGHCP